MADSDAQVSRDALTPLAVNLRPSSFYANTGGKVRLDAWICNDTHQVPTGAVLRDQVKQRGRVIRTGTLPAKIEALEPVYQGRIVFDAPSVDSVAA